MENGACFTSKSARVGKEGVITGINYQCQGHEQQEILQELEY